MYTLEDDQETSSRLRKRDFTEASSAGASEGGTSSAQHSSSLRLSPQQITSSLKKLTTPAKTNAGGKGVALAALTIACIGVFFTALDQTVVVTALPQIVTDLQLRTDTAYAARSCRVDYQCVPARVHYRHAAHGARIRHLRTPSHLFTLPHHLWDRLYLLRPG